MNRGMQYNSGLLREIINFHKTPLHITCEKVIQKNCQNLMALFQKYYPPTSFFYSYKANSVPAILKIIHNEGFGAEVASNFELDLALRLKNLSDKIIFTGANKGIEGIRKAVDSGIRLINIDSYDDLILVKKIAEEKQKKIRIGLRIKSLYDKGAHFGFSFNVKELLRIVNIIKNCKWFELNALHCHQGSNIRKIAPYLKAIKNIARLAYAIKKTTGIEIESLDLGGGFAINTVRNISLSERILAKYLNYPIRIKENLRIEDFASRISFCLKNEFGRFGLRLPKLLLEPGRSIVSDTQDLFLSVISIKGNTVVVDGGLFNISLPLLMEKHSVGILQKEMSKGTKYYSIRGNLCTPHDIFFDKIRLPRLETGDVLIIKDSGAYFDSLSSNFSFPRPAVVMIHLDNTFELIRRRENFEDMINRDKIE